ncbi:hypothetical protein, partial [Aeromonas sp. QDB59]|uniref:hypothetical protein n=1 Tax=Aeromonas sp. QDB59 TaxID=2990497 RepID=UPI0022E7C0A1
MKKAGYIPNASQLSLTGIVFTRFSRRILLWFGFDAPWVIPIGLNIRSALSNLGYKVTSPAPHR